MLSNRYQYQPLQPGEIRLFQLREQEDLDDDRIRIDIINIPFEKCCDPDSGILYDALSYVWGGERTIPIYCGDQEILATPSLVAALSMIRESQRWPPPKAKELEERKEASWRRHEENLNKEFLRKQQDFQDEMAGLQKKRGISALFHSKADELREERLAQEQLLFTQNHAKDREETYKRHREYWTDELVKLWAHGSYREML